LTPRVARLARALGMCHCEIRRRAAMKLPGLRLMVVNNFSCWWPTRAAGLLEPDCGAHAFTCQSIWPIQDASCTWL
jgi:hypothetical protein